MPNMSYCRFQNTAADLADCVNAIEEQGTDELEEEARAGYPEELEALQMMHQLARKLVNDLLPAGVPDTPEEE
jgi:hypothetical protein